MILTHLSMFRAPRMGRDMPHVPTAEDRIRRYRAHAPVQFANTRFTGSQSGRLPSDPRPAGCRLTYATAETLDGRDFDTEGYFHE